MMKPEMTVVRFETEDILTASNTHAPTPTYYVFKGLGYNKTGDNGSPLTIMYGNEDVTDSYITFVPSYSNYKISTSGTPVWMDLLETGYTAEYLEQTFGVRDGNYDLNENIFSLVTPSSGKD